MAGLTAIGELEVLAEELLLEDPVLKLRPLAEPLLVVLARPRGPSPFVQER